MARMPKHRLLQLPLLLAMAAATTYVVTATANDHSGDTTDAHANLDSSSSIRRSADCSSQSDCGPARRCVGIMTGTLGSFLRMCDADFSSSTCRCIRLPTACTDSRDCSDGYGCIRLSYLYGHTMCIHCNFAAAIRQFDRQLFSSIDDMPRCTPSASPIPPTLTTISYSTSSNDGNTWDMCNETLPACRGSRICARWRQDRERVECNAESGYENCYCRLTGDETCTKSSDCEQGDRCIRVVTQVAERYNEMLCVSCAYVRFAVDIVTVDSGDEKCYATRAGDTTGDGDGDSGTGPASGDESADTGTDGKNDDADGDDADGDGNGEGNESDVCVDARALGHLSERELVFQRHRHGIVLCDSFGSCATAGHVVVYRGTAMMMRSYCTRIARWCVRRTILVNSARMRLQRRIASRTAGLEYTVFAARFGTLVEERILSTIVHAGL